MFNIQHMYQTITLWFVASKKKDII